MMYCRLYCAFADELQFGVCPSVWSTTIDLCMCYEYVQRSETNDLYATASGKAMHLCLLHVMIGLTAWLPTRLMDGC